MQKLLDRTTADHAVIQNKMFCLAKIVAVCFKINNLLIYQFLGISEKVWSCKYS
jgi:hypothetical protein